MSTTGLDPSRFARGDALTLSYDSTSHPDSPPTTRNALVWEVRDDELVLTVEMFNPDRSQNLSFTYFVTTHGEVVRRERRGEGNPTRVVRGREATLTAGWNAD